MSTKTNKSLLKRLKLTKNGKVLSRKPGHNHFMAKQTRSKKLSIKKMQSFTLTKKDIGQFLPHQ